MNKKRNMSDNEIAINCQDNLISSLKNRLREIYNLGYKDGFEDGGEYMLDQLRLRVMTDYEDEDDE